MIDDIKIQYCRLLILQSDLMDNNNVYGNGVKDIICLSKNIKNNILNLYLLIYTLKDLNKYVRNGSLVLKRKQLLNDLEFMNHMRNIIGGHIDTMVIAMRYNVNLLYLQMKQKMIIIIS